MSLTTLQQRIHRSRLEADMDDLYDETEEYYVDNIISFNVARAFWRELNKRFWCAFRTDTENYPWFDGIIPGPTFDSTTITFDSTEETFDQT